MANKENFGKMTRNNIILLIFITFIILTIPCFGNDSKLQLTPEEKAWIDKSHTVRVRIGSAPPFMLTDGKIRGIAIDYLTSVFNQHGIKFVYVQESEVTWPQALKYIEQHDVVDMVPTAKITYERKKHMIFTNEYITAPWVIFTRSDADFISSIEDLKGKTVSVEEGFVIHEKLKKDYPEINLKVVSAKLDNNFAEIPIRDLSTGLVDAYIGNLIMTTYMIQSKGYTNVKVAAPTPFDNHNQAMAIRDDWPELASIINKMLAAMTPEEHAAIRNRWLSIRYEYGINKVYVLKWVLSITGIAFFIIGVVLIWNRRLSKEIQERKQAIEALRKSEENYKALAENPNSIVMRFDPKGNILFVNQYACQLFGYSFKEMMGKKSTDLIHPEIQDDGQRAEDLFANFLNHPERFQTNENANLTKDGKRLWISWANTPTYDESGQLTGLICTGFDTTDKKHMEKQLQQAQKMESIGTLAGGIAHDFNNILFPILGYAEMLLGDVPEDSPFKDSLKGIYTSALRAKSLVKQILTFARQESSELILMKMQPLIKEALKLIRSTIPTTIEIIQDINPDCGVIKADPTQIHQIIMNLATNAYHAMEEKGGELKVSLKQVEFGEYDIIIPDMTPGIYACLTMADTGKGMDKNLTDKIFDPYFTTKAMGKGTGMGLSVVHGIVTDMGGAINVYSEPGKGTEFHVYLPVEKSLSEKQATTSKVQIQGGTEQVLLVDDEEAILIMGKRMLERLGYQVTSRFNSLEALEAFRTNPDKFDLVITDMAMPNMSGDKLSVELTKIRPDIPILLCTGFSETMSEEKAASIGIKGLLMKPIVMKDLAQKIREVLDEN